MSRPAFTSEQTTAALRAFVDEHGRPPTLNEWKFGHYKPSLTVIFRLHGSWTNALADAGLPTRAGNRLPDELARFDEETRTIMARLELGYSLGHVARELGVTGQWLGRRIAAYRKRQGLPPMEFKPSRLTLVELEAVQMRDPLR